MIPSLLQQRRMRRRLDAQIALLVATAEAARPAAVIGLAGGRTSLTTGSAGGMRVGQGGGPWSTWSTTRTRVDSAPVVDAIAGQGLGVGSRPHHPSCPARHSSDHRDCMGCGS